MGTKLYVGNLSFSTEEGKLREAFEADGREVEEVAIITDRATGQKRGFAFVTMGSSADAESAIAALNGRELDGRELNVNEAQERKPRFKSGGYGGGGFGGGGGDRKGRRGGGAGKGGGGRRGGGGGRY